MYYIVDDEPRNPAHKAFILAEFTREYDAEEFTRSIVGKVVTAEDFTDDAPVLNTEVLEAWKRDDHSVQANTLAGQELGTLYHDLGNIPTEPGEELIER